MAKSISDNESSAHNQEGNGLEPKDPSISTDVTVDSNKGDDDSKEETSAEGNDPALAAEESDTQ